MREMSFSSEVKQEMIKNLPKKECCKSAMLCGSLLQSRYFTPQKIEYVTEREYMAKHMKDLFGQVFSQIDTCLVTKKNLKGNTSYCLGIYEEQDVNEICNKLHILPGKICDTQALFCCVDCAKSFLSGVFTAYGQIADPQKEYHLSMYFGNVAMADTVQQIAAENGIELKRQKKDQSITLYLKDSEVISDFLTLCRAGSHAMDLMNTKIYKEVRNYANRSANCDIANQSKAKNAADLQIAAIDYIFSVCGYNYLGEDLQQVALLRKMNPDATLAELAQFSNLGLSKSGIHHRLKKIEAIAAKIKEDNQNETE